MAGYEQPGSWRPYWEAWPRASDPAAQSEWEALALADRSLYARWLWDAIVAQGHNGIPS